MRELEARLLLALAAAEQGHHVILGHKKALNDLILSGRLPPGIFHTKDIKPKKAHLLRRAATNGYLITSQDEEPFVVSDDNDNFAMSRYCPETVAMTERIFCWGEFDRRKLVAAYPDYAEKFIATGSPRADLWRPDMHACHAQGDESPNPGGRHYILFSLSFGIAHHPKPIDRQLRDLKRKGRVKTDDDRRKFIEAYASQRELSRHFIALIRTLAGSLPGMDIIIRPHPVERMEFWQQATDDLDNVQVIREGSVSNWIHSADAVIHNCNTTGMEAAAAGKPVLAYRPIRSEFDKDIAGRVSRECATEAELLDALMAVIQNSPAGDGDATNSRESPQAGHDQRREVLLDRAPNIEGPLASDRIVAEFEKVGEQHRLPHTTFGELSAALDNRWSAGRLVNRIRQLFERSDSHADSLRARGAPYAMAHTASLDAAELESCHDRFSVALGRFHSVRITRHGDSLFILKE